MPKPIARVLTSLELDLPLEEKRKNACTSIIRHLTPINPPNQPDPQPECQYITLPTFLLRNPDIVLEMRSDSSPETASAIPPVMMSGDPLEIEPDVPPLPPENNIHWTVAIPTTLLKPEFREPVVQLPEKIGPAAENFRVAEWVIRIPVVRALCGDKPEQPVKFIENKGLVEWTDGVNPIQCGDGWDHAEEENRIEARITVPRKALRYLPSELRLLRGGIPIATFPGLREVILPSKLRLEALSKTQFALHGKNAGVIDAVGLQEGESPVLTTRGSGFVIVTIPSKDAKKTAEEADSETRRYAVLPLVDDGTKEYIPLDVTDDRDYPLLFTIVFPAKSTKEAPPADETITITKTRNNPPKNGADAVIGKGSIKKK